MASSDTGGVKPMPIAGRMVRERERLLGMTDEERAWRAQWLKDQELAPHEPVYVPAYHRELTNPIRRFYRAPLDALANTIRPIVGPTAAFQTRFWIGKFSIGIALIYCIGYYFKYNTNDWTRKGGWRVIRSRTSTVPGDEGYPVVSDRKVGADYAARGFKDAPI